MSKGPEKYGCNKGKNFQEADAICKAEDLQLCSEDQIMADITRGTGCGYDNEVVWTSSCAQAT
jgi:hypothetical protein